MVFNGMQAVILHSAGPIGVATRTNKRASLASKTSNISGLLPIGWVNKVFSTIGGCYQQRVAKGCKPPWALLACITSAHWRQALSLLGPAAAMLDYS